jgi:hypothetical protein
MHFRQFSVSPSLIAVKQQRASVTSTESEAFAGSPIVANLAANGVCTLRRPQSAQKPPNKLAHRLEAVHQIMWSAG